jgi:hypothetical protein
MLDRYKLAAEIREFLLDREGKTAAELADGLVDMFVVWCREMYGEQPEKK